MSPKGNLSNDHLNTLFTVNRERLRRMIQLRMDRRLAGRIDASDIIQDAFVEASERFAEFQQSREVSEFVWLRFLTVQKLAAAHRFHLGVQARDARRELRPGRHIEASSADLAAQLVGNLTSPSNAAGRREQKRLVQETLNQMTEVDREILALRHFEQLDNAETAAVLGIEKQAAYRRHVRAIRRLQELLNESNDDEALSV